MQLDKFTQAYIEAALWSSTMDDGDCSFESAGYGIDDIAPETINEMVKDCTDFQTSNKDSLQAAYTLEETYKYYYDEERAGHDFWFARNHHGAGFWDRGLETIGEALTDNAHAYGECNLYLGDDELIHCE